MAFEKIARSNNGVGFLPIGTVVPFAGEIAEDAFQNREVFKTDIEPYGWVVCDGRTVEIRHYQKLYTVIGERYNAGSEAVNKFSLPDYRGQFLRMVDLNSGKDPDAHDRFLANGDQSDGVGSVQEDALQEHQHTYKESSSSGEKKLALAGDKLPLFIKKELSSTPTNKEDKLPGTVRVAQETRPKNNAVYYIIKYM
ncbi:MAG: tail fiber protein [Crocinitomicaceae bacterium]|nr:phage tail protein [Flavobacteriales bacterium]NQZ36907.1 tail fiber protein [Crocinitomicaceae bacterium]